MLFSHFLRCSLAGALFFAATSCLAGGDAMLRVFPTEFQLRGAAARQQLIAGAWQEGRWVDVTQQVQWT
ncbi:MAG: hypothetical protein QF805_25300, partial [Pirellulaceae bacterium]|nr:hypothetical protein [Pirellulaceae bacterium]